MPATRRVGEGGPTPFNTPEVPDARRTDRRPESQPGRPVSNGPRPVLLGYIRADVLHSATEVERAQAHLFGFADREEFSLGTVYVEWGITVAAFHSLMAELAHDEAAWGVLVPDLRHLTDGVRQVLSGPEEGVQTRIVVANFFPRSGAAGAESPARATSAEPPPPCCAEIPHPRRTAAEAEDDAGKARGTPVRGLISP